MITIIYEDQNYQDMHAMIKRMRQLYLQYYSSNVGIINSGHRTIEALTVQGTGNFNAANIMARFSNLVTNDGTEINRRDYIILLADADRCNNLVRGTNPNTLHNTTDIKNFERRWKGQLCSDESLQLRRNQIICKLIRWSYESFFTTLPEMLLDYATAKTSTCPHLRSQLSTIFQRCQPNPTTINTPFTPTRMTIKKQNEDLEALQKFLLYQTPQKCMQNITSNLPQHLKKKERYGPEFGKYILNSTQKDDYLHKLLQRNIDLRNLVRILCILPQ